MLPSVIADLAKALSVKISLEQSPDDSEVDSRGLYNAMSHLNKEVAVPERKISTKNLQKAVSMAKCRYVAQCFVCCRTTSAVQVTAS